MDETQRAIEEGIRRGIESANRGPEFIEWLMAVIRGLRRVRAPAVAIAPEARNARPASPGARPALARRGGRSAGRCTPTSEEREEIKALRKEIYELRRANEILKAASVLRDRARCRRNELSRFSDEHRGRFGVEPICRTLGVSASACYSTSGLGTPCESGRCYVHHSS
jgi:transposase